jgi:RNA polymerase sigma-70 factor (ECF subfamily)
VSELPDTELLIRARTDPEAFGCLHDRHADAIYGFLVRRLGASHAEDLVSEVFLRAFEARHRVRPHETGSALPWLYGIARNVLRQHARAKPRPLPTEAVDTSTWALVDDRLDADAMSEELQAAVAGLSEVEREVLLLTSWEQLTISETATVLGITPNAVRVRLHRARAHAAAALAAVPHPFQTQEQ